MSYKWRLWANNPQTQTLTGPNQRTTTVENQDITEISVDCWKKQREQTKNNQNKPGNKNSDANTSNPNSNINNKNYNNKNSNRAERKPKTVYPPCETCGKTNHSTEKCYYGANAADRPPPRHRRPERQNQVQKRASQNNSNETAQAPAQNLNWKCNVFTPELRMTVRRQLNFHQSQRLSGTKLRRLIYLFFIKRELLKLKKHPHDWI